MVFSVMEQHFAAALLLQHSTDLHLCLCHHLCASFRNMCLYIHTAVSSHHNATCVAAAFPQPVFMHQLPHQLGVASNCFCIQASIKRLFGISLLTAQLI